MQTSLKIIGSKLDAMSVKHTVAETWQSTLTLSASTKTVTASVGSTVAPSSSDPTPDLTGCQESTCPRLPNGCDYFQAESNM